MERVKQRKRQRDGQRDRERVCISGERVCLRINVKFVFCKDLFFKMTVCIYISVWVCIQEWGFLYKLYYN